MSDAPFDPSAPRVLILGGIGFIGRNLVKYLYDNRLVSYIKVCDKSHHVTSYLSEAHKVPFANKDVVKFQQSDLSRDDHVNRAFDDEKGFDIVVNLCGETRFGLTEEDYRVKNVETAKKCGKKAIEVGVKRFIEVSTAQVYEPSKAPATEDATIGPWTTQAAKRLEAENELIALKNLPLVILRPAIVYGPGDLTGITPRCAVAAVYQHLGEKMENLWGEDLRLNTVHVDDVCKAIWLAANEIEPGHIYNLADSSDLSQGKLNKYLGNMFGIKTGFFGLAVRMAAKVALGSVADHANDKHVPAWGSIVQEHKMNTPVSPYIDKELLQNKDLFIDGSKITRYSSFTYDHPDISEEAVRAQIQAFVDQGLFPNVLK